MRYLLAASFVLWLHLSGSASAGPPGSVLTSPFANPDWSIADVSGNTYRPWTEPQTQAVVLVFIGSKMLAMPWFHVPIQWSLSIVASIILVSVAASLALSRPKPLPAREHA